MSPVESIAADTLVIGVAEGDVRETAVDGTTGILASPDPDAEMLVSAVEQLSQAHFRAMRPACERFLSRMRESIESTAPHPFRAG